MKTCMPGIAMFFLLIVQIANSQSNDWTMKFKSDDFSLKEISEVSLFAITADTLKYRSGRLDRQVHVDSIQSLSRTKGDLNVVRSIAIGAIGLGGGGFLIGQALGQDNQADSYYGYSSSDTKGSDLKVILPIVGVAVGAGLGAALAPKGETVTYSFATMSSQEKVALINSLIAGIPQPVQRGMPPPEQRDLLTLKNGSIIRGNATEIIPDSVIKIQTTDGSMFVFKTEEVERLSKEPVAQITAPPAQSIDLPRPTEWSERRMSFSLRAGLGIPIGSFGSTSGQDAAGAKLGFAARGELNYPVARELGWIGSVTGSFNSLENPSGSNLDVGSWSSIFVTTGLRLGGQSANLVKPYMQGELGILFGSTPSMSGSGGGFTVSQPSASGSAFAFGIGTGVIINERFHLSLNYLRGVPEFTVTATATGPQTATATATGEVPMSVILFGAGVSF